VDAVREDLLSIQVVLIFSGLLPAPASAGSAVSDDVRRAELQVWRAVEPRADVLQILLDVPERERHGAILSRHSGRWPSQ
jgi:hypothetical protein